jgi:hypothetical protein
MTKSKDIICPKPLFFRYLDDQDIDEAVKLQGAERGERVRFIYNMISESRWSVGRTGPELSYIWQIQLNTVNQYAAEAYRHFKLQLGDPDELRGALMEKLNYVVDSSMKAKKPFLTKEGELVYADAPDHRSAINGIVAMGDLCGLRVRKVEHKLSKAEYDKQDLESLMKVALEELEKSKAITAEGEESNEYTLPERVSPPASSEDSGRNNLAERVRGRRTGRSRNQ